MRTAGNVPGQRITGRNLQRVERIKKREKRLLFLTKLSFSAFLPIRINPRTDPCEVPCNSQNRNREPTAHL